jgi:hypothetical protein
MNIMQLAVRDMDETRDIAAQIEQRVHFHGGLLVDRKCAQGNTDMHKSMGRGIQRINAVGLRSPVSEGIASVVR